MSRMKTLASTSWHRLNPGRVDLRYMARFLENGLLVAYVMDRGNRLACRARRVSDGRVLGDDTKDTLPREVERSLTGLVLDDLLGTHPAPAGIVTRLATLAKGG